MKGIIVAAGPGSRLAPLTLERPKCTLRVRGKAIIEYQIRALRAAGIEEIAIVKGHRAEKLHVPGTRSYLNPDYLNNNILHSLFYAESEFDDDLVVSYSDIVYEPEVAQGLVRNDGPFCVVADFDWRSGYVGRLDHPVEEAENIVSENGCVVRIGKHLSPAESDSEFIGLCKIERAGLEVLVRTFHEIEAQGLDRPFQQAATFRKAYLTDMFQELIDSGQVVRTFPIRGGWAEIDTLEDYRNAGGDDV